MLLEVRLNYIKLNIYMTDLHKIKVFAAASFWWFIEAFEVKCAKNSNILLIRLKAVVY